MNFTNAVDLITTSNHTYLSAMMMTVMSLGYHVNQECWLKFPFICVGCEFEQMKDDLMRTEFNDTFQLLTNVCNIIEGVEENSGTIVVDDITTVKQLKYHIQYDSHIRPSFPIRADVINVGIQIMSLENLDLTDATFKIDFFLNQEWTDKRLKHNYPGILDGGKLRIGVWRPDSYFVQSKRGKSSQLKHDGISLKIRGDGHIFYGSRMTIEVVCPMDLHEFPMDIQTCLLELQSYASLYDEVQYKWLFVNISMDDLRGSLRALSQYDLEPIIESESVSHYVLGSWSTLRLELTFVRNSMIFIPAMYFPCAMVVFISWITFLLDVDHYSARTYLCVTSLLTIVTLQSAINASLPWVSYLKAIDKYVMVCILYISAAFMEYACVLYIASKKRHYDMKNINNKKAVTEKFDSTQKKEEWTNTGRTGRTGCRRKKYRCRKSLSYLAFSVHQKNDYLIRTKYEKLIRFYLNEGLPKKLDKFSRIFFPTTFMIFNAVYWVSSGDAKLYE